MKELYLLGTQNNYVCVHERMCNSPSAIKFGSTKLFASACACVHFIRSRTTQINDLLVSQRFCFLDNSSFCFRFFFQFTAHLKRLIFFENKRIIDTHFLLWILFVFTWKLVLCFHFFSYRRFVCWARCHCWRWLLCLELLQRSTRCNRMKIHSSTRSFTRLRYHENIYTELNTAWRSQAEQKSILILEEEAGIDLSLSLENWKRMLLP